MITIRPAEIVQQETERLAKFNEIFDPCNAFPQKIETKKTDRPGQLN